MWAWVKHKGKKSCSKQEWNILRKYTFWISFGNYQFLFENNHYKNCHLIIVGIYCEWFKEQEIMIKTIVRFLCNRVSKAKVKWENCSNIA